MRSLLVLVLLVVAGVGGFLSRPDIEAHRKHADEVLKEGKSSDAIGDLIGAVFSNRNDSFEDLMVVTKLTTKDGDKVVLECWGAYTQFFCTEPDEKKS